jgi:hypothetical protein
MQLPPPATIPSSDSLDDSARWEYLNAHLSNVEGATERWYAGWTSTFAALAIAQYGFAAAAPNAGLREISLVGAINSTLGLGAMLIAPNTLDGSREKLEQFDATTPLGAFERRRRAEYLLHATEAEERYWHGPVPFILALVASGAGALVLIEGYDQVVGGLATLGGGIAVTALQMLTRPSSAGTAWRHYVHKYHPSPGTQVPPYDQIDMYMSFAVSPNGVAMQLTF